MYYYISKIYISLKATTAFAGIIGSLLAIIYGVIQTGGTVFIIGGSLCLVNSVFNVIEVGKVNLDIKRQIAELEKSIGKFIAQTDRLQELAVINERNAGYYRAENHKLKKLVEKSELQIVKMEDIQNGLKDQLTAMNKNAEKFEELKIQYSVEIDNLRNTICELEVQVHSLEELTVDYRQENLKFAEQVKHQQQIIIDSRELIKNLAQFGDTYSHFAETLNGEIHNLNETGLDLAQTSNLLKRLVDKLKGEKFSEFDLNKDGVITQEEFESELYNQSQ